MTIALSNDHLAQKRPMAQKAGQSPAWEVWRGLRRSSSGKIGMVLVTVHLCVALLAPLFVPYDPASFDTTAIRATPSIDHLFGTDKLGRDVFSRTLLGGRIVLMVTVLGTALAVV